MRVDLANFASFTQNTRRGPNFAPKRSHFLF